MSGMRRIPLSSPEIIDEDVRMVMEVLESRYLASGPVAEQFERETAERFGARFAVAASSGTAALHMALIAADVKARSLVITSPFSFIASSNTILYQGGIPIFVDVDPETLTIDSQKAIDAIDAIAHRRRGWRALLPRSVGANVGTLRAVLPVHIFGRPCEMRDLVPAARTAGIAVVEDACQAVGAAADGTWAGRWGEAGVFGFYPNKQITSGEGGMLLTDDPAWDQIFRSLRNQGRADDRDWFRYDRLGFNYRLDEMSSALGLSQLRRLDHLVARRRAIVERYAANLAGVPDISPLPPGRPGMTVSWFLFMIRVSPRISRDALMARLSDRGIMTRPYFWPIHLQTFYVEQFGYVRGDFPAAEAAGDSLLALPMSLAADLEEVDYVCDAVVEEVHALRGNSIVPREAATP